MLCHRVDSRRNTYMFLCYKRLTVMRLLMGIRRKLDGTEWHGRTRKGVTHLLSSDQRVDASDEIVPILRSRIRRKPKSRTRFEQAEIERSALENQ